MKEDSITSLFGIRFGWFSRKHDLEVSVNKCEPDKRQIHHVRDILLLHQVRVSEHWVTAAEDPGVKEGQWFRGQEDEEVREDANGTHEPDETNEAVGASRRTDLCVAKRVADGDVTLNSHAGQVQRRVERSEDGNHQQETTEGDVNGEENVADDVQEYSDGQLNYVIEHHVDVEDVAWVLRENSVPEEGVNKRPVDVVDGDAQSHHYHIFGHCRCKSVSYSDCGHIAWKVHFFYMCPVSDHKQ